MVDVNGSNGPPWNTAVLAGTLDQVGFPLPADQVQPDRQGVAASAHPQLNGFLEKLAGTRGWIAIGVCRFPASQLHAKAGGHPMAGFEPVCRPQPTRRPHSHSRRLQVA